jgi:hypothetical protein
VPRFADVELTWKHPDGGETVGVRGHGASRSFATRARVRDQPAPPKDDDAAASLRGSTGADAMLVVFVPTVTVRPCRRCPPGPRAQPYSSRTTGTSHVRFWSRRSRLHRTCSCFCLRGLKRGRARGHCESLFPSWSLDDALHVVGDCGGAQGQSLNGAIAREAVGGVTECREVDDGRTTITLLAVTATQPRR